MRNTRDKATIRARQAKVDAEFVRYFFDYNSVTGNLIWRVSKNGRAPVGSVAGCLRKDGYRTVGLNGVPFLAHRLVWLHVTGEWPLDDLDHIDCDPRNNRFENLRVANTSQNHCNLRVPRNNTSGYKGVMWAKRECVWIARIKLHGKTRSLGQFGTAEAAHLAYVKASKEIHGEFGRVK